MFMCIQVPNHHDLSSQYTIVVLYRHSSGLYTGKLGHVDPMSMPYDRTHANSINHSVHWLPLPPSLWLWKHSLPTLRYDALFARVFRETSTETFLEQTFCYNNYCINHWESGSLQVSVLTELVPLERLTSTHV